ncbi:steroid 5-alpha reductase family enzyme [Marmoricola sp. URHA0025 HA25]
MTDFLLVSAAAAAVCLVAMLLTAYAARRAGRVSVVDVTWGIALAAVALVSAVLGDGDPLRRWLFVALVTVWGFRLSWHIWRRNTGHGEDPRYTELLGSKRGGPVVRVWIPQGAAIWFVSLPVQVSAVAGGGIGAVVGLGVALWVVGVFFEAVGDAQLAAYKKDPGRGPVMDRGLWRFTRHPNYFGDACVWWGLWTISASAWPGVLTVPAPLAMTYFLVYATGARLLEETMMKRPGYPAYAARTSMFVPLPPRRAA